MMRTFNWTAIPPLILNLCIQEVSRLVDQYAEFIKHEYTCRFHFSVLLQVNI